MSFLYMQYFTYFTYYNIKHSILFWVLFISIKTLWGCFAEFFKRTKLSTSNCKALSFCVLEGCHLYTCITTQRVRRYMSATLSFESRDSLFTINCVSKFDWKLMIDCKGFYAVSAIFRPFNGRKVIINI